MIELIAIVALGATSVFTIFALLAERKERLRMSDWVCVLIKEQQATDSKNHGRLIELAKLVKYRGVEEEAVAAASLSPRVFDDRHGDDGTESDIHLEKADEEFLRSLGIGEDVPSPQWDEH